MKLWMPDRVYFEPAAMDYPAGERIYQFCKDNEIPILKTTSHNQIRDIPGETEKAKFANAKRTLVVGVKKSLKLDVCKPSADFQFSLTTNCPGNCEYCYLFSTQGTKPYVRVYVNMDDLFHTIDQYIEERLPESTTFEAASTGDPLAVEHITGQLRETVEYFGRREHGSLRIVSKFSNVDSLLDAQHNGKTLVRFSISSKYVVDHFEHNTAALNERLEAAGKISEAGYPIGFIVAPIMIHDQWKEEFEQLFDHLSRMDTFQRQKTLPFELIQHRFTSNAKEIIRQRYPNTKLDMDEEKRVAKFGKYGRVKYVYPKDQAAEMKDYISGLILSRFENAKIQYFT